MKRQIAIVAVGLVALSCAGLAVAKGIEGHSTATAVAGTFTATTATGRTDTRTCTTTDGKAIVETHGTFTGASTGATDFTGPVTIDSHSVINTTDNVGTVDGSFRIDVASGRDTYAGYSAVYSGGTIAGLAVGRAHAPSARLIANLSAGFAAATGFTSGKLGGGTTGGMAVEVSGASCKSSATKPEKSEARGTVTAVSSSSITVAGLTCAVPADKAKDVAKLAVNDRAEIHCSLSSGVNTLTRVEKKR